MRLNHRVSASNARLHDRESAYRNPHSARNIFVPIKTSGKMTNASVVGRKSSVSPMTVRKALMSTMMVNAKVNSSLNHCKPATR